MGSVSVSDSERKLESKVDDCLLPGTELLCMHALAKLAEYQRAKKNVECRIELEFNDDGDARETGANLETGEEGGTGNEDDREEQEEDSNAGNESESDNAGNESDNAGNESGNAGNESAGNESDNEGNEGDNEG
eukprot:1200855-Rhodomonas_salina.1